MASPNIIFLSQAILSGDGTMCCRIAHEIAHAWFGLLIGASDWTEEWLSEGFATFCEDIFHAKTLKFSDKEREDFCQMKAYFRSKTLMSEIQNTDEDLHVLRPNKGQPVIENIEDVDAVILKNGQNPDKCFMQVHYIKGYFLLKYLSDVIGLEPFIQFLNLYVQKFKGKLVDSVEMLELFISVLPDTCPRDLTVESITAEWLHSSKVPERISLMSPPLSNEVFSIALQEADKWKKLNRLSLSRRNPKRKKYDVDQFENLSSDSLLVLFDLLLEENTISASILKLLNNAYDIEKKNAEVCHKWCELVVKHRYYAGYPFLKHYLHNYLAMGIYLYGELLLNGTKSQQAFAKTCFEDIKSEMEPNSITVIQEMLQLCDQK